MISYKKKKYRLFSALLLLAFGVYGSLFKKMENNYIEGIKKLRSHYNQYIKYYEDSPLEQDKISYFNELDYYQIDELYKINAKFSELNPKDTFYISLTKEKRLVFLKYGKATFSYKGEPQELILLKDLKSESNRLFMPFKDKTNGKTTYGSGRYLDVNFNNENEVVIDFNLAYNPYCAYNKNYKCPMVPSENVIDKKITAGEKAFTLQANSIAK